MISDWVQDAGHGGSDPGAVANGIREKDYTLEAALYVSKRLKEHGIKSTTTRTTDTTLAQSTRTNKVSKHKKCISHHFNAGGGNGFETIHSQYSNGSFERLLLDEFKKAGYPVRPTPIFTKKLKSGRDYYYMHRETGSCRTTIIEYDFVDGPNASKLKDKKYREGMYECVVKAICKEEGIAYKPLASNSPKKETKKVERDIHKPSDWAVKEGIIEKAKKYGISDGSRPGATMTREEGMAMAVRLYESLKDK